MILKTSEFIAELKVNKAAEGHERRVYVTGLWYRNVKFVKDSTDRELLECVAILARMVMNSHHPTIGKLVDIIDRICICKPI